MLTIHQGLLCNGNANGRKQVILPRAQEVLEQFQFGPHWTEHLADRVRVGYYGYVCVMTLSSASVSNFIVDELLLLVN